MMMDEVDAYKKQAWDDASHNESVELTIRLEEKSHALDQLWHDLSAVQTTLSWYPR